MNYSLKLQSISFASLSPSLFEYLELQFLVELLFAWIVLRHGSRRMNLMF